MVKYSPAIPAFAYEWKLGDGSVAEHFVQAVNHCMSPDHCFMAVGDLHCMLHYSPQGPDDRFEVVWCNRTCD